MQKHFDGGKMDLSFLPSLQTMAAIKIMTRLWHQSDVVALIAGCNDYYYRGERWQEIEKRVKEKISLLCQPAPLREKLSSFVAPIGDEIRRWEVIHVLIFNIKNIPREFRWTSRGMLDKKGTAEAFVRDPTFPEEERYSMACLYCLEWDDPVPFLETESLQMSESAAYWTYDRTGDATALDRAIGRHTSRTPYQCAFKWAVTFGNVVAAEYYFHKLDPGEKEESLSDFQLPLYYLTDFDAYRFLLLHMDEGQRSKLLEAHGERVLECSLEWPWQQFFVEVAPLVRDTLRPNQYSRLLSKIVKMIKEGYLDYGYRDLFSQFWMEIPPDRKKEVMRDCDLLSELFPFVGEKNISLMLKEASPEEREQILLSERSVDICESLALQHQRDSLECFIRECMTSRDKMIRFKEECQKSAKYFGSTFFQFLDELTEKGSEKRGAQEMDCPVPHKTLCGSPGVSTHHA